MLCAMFPLASELKSSLPGLRYPSYRDAPIKSTELWLQGKRRDDNAEGLWRVHDDLYDFSTWIDKHPGGCDWLTLTKGTDITEAFEAHHISEKPELLLKQFHVRHATEPRNSPYTFHDDGFYRTLKRKVRKLLSESRPRLAWKSIMFADTLLASSLLSAVLAADTRSFLLGSLSGVLLALTVVSAHNFFHQRDNLRMYYFDLSFMSSRMWRVSHALSHHLYPNSVLDLEMSLLEPFLQYLPRRSKPWWIRYGAWVASPFVYSFLFHGHIFIRLGMIAKKYTGALKKEDLLPLLVPFLMLMYSDCGVKLALLMWTWIILVSSFVFGAIGLNAGHHHPEIFHDGDTPRSDRDWGLSQVDAVRDRPEISSSLFLVLVSFGDHCLHHLFPTVDHSHLYLLYPVFNETCREFGINYHYNSVLQLVKGQFWQLSNNKPNLNPPGKK